MFAVCSVIHGHADRQKEDKQRRELMDHGATQWGCHSRCGASAPESHYSGEEEGPGLLSWLHWSQPCAGLCSRYRPVEDRDKHPHSGTRTRTHKEATMVNSNKVGGSCTHRPTMEAAMRLWGWLSLGHRQEILK